MADEGAFSCAIVTPEAPVFDGQVDFAALPAHDGEIGILRDRAPLLCKLGIGVLRVRTGDTQRSWFVDGGFAQVIDNRLTVLTQQAKAPEAIDRAAVERDLAKAQSIAATDDRTRQARADAIARARTQIKLVSTG
jgi:F-type H+-transporting ATPase subunit epsilon